MAQPFQSPRRPKKGARHIFADYRLGIAAVIRDYGITERAEAPDDLRASRDAAQA
jgi:hypothetical protein